eukprot:scaffold286107_cov46-Prasinocladus_malaysianus.AAC.1
MSQAELPFICRLDTPRSMLTSKSQTDVRPFSQSATERKRPSGDHSWYTIWLPGTSCGSPT